MYYFFSLAWRESHKYTSSFWLLFPKYITWQSIIKWQKNSIRRRKKKEKKWSVQQIISYWTRVRRISFLFQHKVEVTQVCSNLIKIFPSIIVRHFIYCLCGTSIFWPSRCRWWKSVHSMKFLYEYLFPPCYTFQQSLKWPAKGNVNRLFCCNRSVPLGLE